MVETVESAPPYLVEFLNFLGKYGDVRYEKLQPYEGNGYRIVAGDVECRYRIFILDRLSHTGTKDGSIMISKDPCDALFCEIRYQNSIKSFAAVREGESFRRLDAWDIPFP